MELISRDNSDLKSIRGNPQILQVVRAPGFSCQFGQSAIALIYLLIGMLLSGFTEVCIKLI